MNQEQFMTELKQLFDSCSSDKLDDTPSHALPNLNANTTNLNANTTNLKGNTTPNIHNYIKSKQSRKYSTCIFFSCFCCVLLAGLLLIATHGESKTSHADYAGTLTASTIVKFTQEIMTDDESTIAVVGEASMFQRSIMKELSIHSLNATFVKIGSSTGEEGVGGAFDAVLLLLIPPTGNGQSDVAQMVSDACKMMRNLRSNQCKMLVVDTLQVPKSIISAGCACGLAPLSTLHSSMGSDADKKEMGIVTFTCTERVVDAARRCISFESKKFAIPDDEL